MESLRFLESLTKGTILFNEPMAKHTSYGIGGPVDAYIVPKDSEELANILKYSNDNKFPVYFIGSGSNLLVSDQGINGIVISPRNSLKKLEFTNNTIIAESGVMLGKLVKESTKRNLSGLESLIGVPGTLGGALVMNAGAFGSEISKYLKYVKVMNMKGQIIKYNINQIKFSYRFSTLKKDEFILSASFQLLSETLKIIEEKKQFASMGRKTNQPLKYRSAGSVFKNPENYAAGYLIDQVGLKGKKIGDAQISDHHANFFINHGNAMAKDITSLIKLARKEVFKKFSIQLELEVKTIGIKKKELLSDD